MKAIWNGQVIAESNDTHVIEGIVVAASRSFYVFPIHMVKRIINVDEDNLINSSATEFDKLVDVDSQVLPLMPLSSSANGADTDTDRRIALVLSYQNETRGVIVDELVGMQQVLVTPLTGTLKDCNHLQGCAVLGRDRIGMVVKPNALFAA